MKFLADIFGGSLLEGVKSVIGALKLDPAKKAELEAAAIASQVELSRLELELEAKLEEVVTRRVEAVNATMQAEAKSDSWAQRSWRPVVGFTFSAVILNNYVALAYLRPYGLAPVDIPGDIWSAMLVVLGVAAGTRGWEKITRNGTKNGA